MADMSELPPEPTPADLARAILQLHGCVETHKSDTRAAFAEMGEKLDGLGKVLARVRAAQAGVKRALSGEKTRTDARLKGLESGQAALMTTVGADKLEPKPTVAAMSQRKALTLGVVIAAFAAFPGLDALIKFMLPVLKTALAYIGAH